jgi:hypothetical protein
LVGGVGGRGKLYGARSVGMDDNEDESEVDAAVEAAIEGVAATAVVSMIDDVGMVDN